MASMIQIQKDIASLKRGLEAANAQQDETLAEMKADIDKLEKQVKKLLKEIATSKQG